MQRRAVLIGGGAVVLVGGAAALLQTRSMGSMGDYSSSIAATRAPWSKSEGVAGLVRYATLAANGHNAQPWRFRLDANGVRILPDLARRTPAADPDDHHLFVSLGCAAENLALAAAASAQPGELAFVAEDEGSIQFTFGGGALAEPALFGAIPLRQSTRSEYDGRSVSTDDLRSLAAAAAVEGVELVLITERARIREVRDLVLESNRLQMGDAAFVSELKSWLRFHPRQALATRDGLFSGSSGRPSIPAWLGTRGFDLLFRVDAENDSYARQIDSAAGLAVFFAQDSNKEGWTRVGRALQRFALQATALGIRHAFVNQPVEVASARPRLAAILDRIGQRPDLVLRFGYGPLLPYSARRPVEDVLA